MLKKCKRSVCCSVASIFVLLCSQIAFANGKASSSSAKKPSSSSSSTSTTQTTTTNKSNGQPAEQSSNTSGGGRHWNVNPRNPRPN